MEAMEKDAGSTIVDRGTQFQESHIHASNTHNPYIDSSIAYEDRAVVENQSRLRRLFSFLQLLAFALTFMSSWEVVAMNMGATFYNGGSSALVWGCLLVVIGSLAQALSMAELGAILPIGEQYLER
jgi:hypothetical protein